MGAYIQIPSKFFISAWLIYPLPSAPNLFSIYKEAFRKEFLTTTTPKSQHINAIKLSGKAHTANNNKMERIKR